MSKSLREKIAKLPVTISKHQNSIIAVVLTAGLFLGTGLFVGELWGEGKVERPLTPSSQNYLSGRVQGVNTNSGDPAASSESADASVVTSSNTGSSSPSSTGSRTSSGSTTTSVSVSTSNGNWTVF